MFWNLSGHFKLSRHESHRVFEGLAPRCTKLRKLASYELFELQDLRIVGVLPTIAACSVRRGFTWSKGAGWTRPFAERLGDHSLLRLVTHEFDGDAISNAETRLLERSVLFDLIVVEYAFALDVRSQPILVLGKVAFIQGLAEESRPLPFEVLVRHVIGVSPIHRFAQHDEVVRHLSAPNNLIARPTIG